ncbi:MAG TPA: protein-L-isoaspartate O-methyltransferase [Syntrophus sp. (in: bacteria)]|jgi:protein-L-isoaspartate(D-aspartate) O-methyltransferase|nr:protein-L-isoaspartate O-methyltransferase [Syntrophus sp. (in: bacteria)]
MKRTGAILALLLLLTAPSAPADDAERAARDAMVRTQIADRGIRDPDTLAAMRAVPRHRFVPPDLAASAYADQPLPIGYGQTISQPYIVAVMTETLRLKPGHKVLEIGAGSGYQAAVLARIVREVFTIEIVPELGNAARERLRTLGCRNVRVRVADGYDGWPEEAPFDAIVVTAAADHIPPPLIRQLRDGGRMVIPVGSPFFVQTLMLVEKDRGKIRTTSLMPVRFVPFTRRR